MTTTPDNLTRAPQGRKRLPIDEERPPYARRLGEALQRNCPPRSVLTLNELARPVPTSISTVSRAMRAESVPIWETLEGIAGELYKHRDRVAPPQDFPLREDWYALWRAAWEEQGGKPYDMTKIGHKGLPTLTLTAHFRSGLLLPGVVKSVVRVAVVLLFALVLLVALGFCGYYFIRDLVDIVGFQTAITAMVAWPLAIDAAVRMLGLRDPFRLVRLVELLGERGLPLPARVERWVSAKRDKIPRE
ncbi:hypothetical protein [Streptomyces xylophagus]|uniref:hypothetical protein n=1 Tax=Streptomyces xylophagus TaxID=285514 RepID=UPI0005BE4C6F|nr:hypothetical protein [Streptomyces xylophagus]